jgi:hypothetical protein
MAPFLRNVTLHTGPFSCSPDSRVPSRRIVERVAKTGTEREVTGTAQDKKPVAIRASEYDRTNVLGGQIRSLVRNAVEPWAHGAVCADPGINKSFPLAPTSSRTPPRHGLANRLAPAVGFRRVRRHDP